MPNSYSNINNAPETGKQPSQSKASEDAAHYKAPVEGSPDQPIRGQAGWQGTGKGPKPVEALASDNGEAISAPGAGPNATFGEWGAAAYDKNKGHTIPIKPRNESI